MDDYILHICIYFRVLIWSYIKLRSALTGWENGVKVIMLLVVSRSLMLMLICILICWFSLTLLNPFFFSCWIEFWMVLTNNFSMNSGLTKKVLQSTISEREAEEQVCSNYTMWLTCSLFVGTYISILNRSNIIVYFQWIWKYCSLFHIVRMRQMKWLSSSIRIV